MVELSQQTSSFIIIKLLLLLYVAKGSSSLNLREKRTIPESNFNPCKVNLTHTLGTPIVVSKQPFAFLSGSWNNATTSDCRTIRTFNVQDIRLQRDCMIVFLSALQNVLPSVGACKYTIKVEWWGTSPLPGPIGY
jgi:hypothetical protein